MSHLEAGDHGGGDGEGRKPYPGGGSRIDPESHLVHQDEGEANRCHESRWYPADEVAHALLGGDEIDGRCPESEHGKGLVGPAEISPRMGF